MDASARSPLLRWQVNEMPPLDVWFRVAAVGATIILVYGRVFNAIRPQAKFFHCPMCVGFHVGWFLALLVMIHSGLEFGLGFLFILFREACVVSLVSYLFGMAISDDGLNVTVHRGDNNG